MAWVSFPSVGAVPGGKPFETFGKDSGLSSEGGSTGRRTDWPCHINIADTVKLLRPSVQLPAGIHGCAVYRDFERAGKRSCGVLARRMDRSHVRLTYLFVCH